MKIAMLLTRDPKKNTTYATCNVCEKIATQFIQFATVPELTFCELCLAKRLFKTEDLEWDARVEEFNKAAQERPRDADSGIPAKRWWQS